MQTRNCNCLQACIASLLELNLQDVPDFNEYSDDIWWEELMIWLNSKGYSLEYIYESPPENGGYYITSLTFSFHKRNQGHAVIFRNGKVVHDPWEKVFYNYNDAEINGFYKIEKLSHV